MTVAAARLLDRDRLHHPAAVGGPVSRILVDVLAEQTGRTVVGKTVALDLGATALAGEILDIARKKTGHARTFALPLERRTRKRVGTRWHPPRRFESGL